ESSEASDGRRGRVVDDPAGVQIAAPDASIGPGLFRERSAAEDRAQDIVEIARDPAGQRSHRSHCLRLAKLDLEPLLLGLRVLARRDVDRRPDEAKHLALPITKATSARMQPVPLAVGMTNAVFRLVM